jgi:hypothetical protein
VNPPSASICKLPRLLALAGLLLCFGLAAGCAGDKPNNRQIDELAQLRYPDQVKNVKDVDVVANQTRTQIRVVNREPVDFTNVYVWLNRQYVGYIRRIEIGNESDANNLDLDGFYNLHKLHYPVGGILSPDRGFPLTTFDIYDPATQTIYRAVVRRPDNLLR